MFLDFSRIFIVGRTTHVRIGRKVLNIVVCVLASQARAARSVTVATAGKLFRRGIPIPASPITKTNPSVQLCHFPTKRLAEINGIIIQ